MIFEVRFHTMQVQWNVLTNPELSQFGGDGKPQYIMSKNTLYYTYIILQRAIDNSESFKIWYW